MSFHTSHHAMQQCTAAVLRRAAKLGIEMVKVVLDIGRCVPAKIGHTETGARGVDDNTRLLDGQQLSQVVDGKVLNQLGKRVPGYQCFL
jgi:hypothetical protein